jgi:hypothetical protein
MKSRGFPVLHYYALNFSHKYVILKKSFENVSLFDIFGSTPGAVRILKFAIYVRLVPDVRHTKYENNSNGRGVINGEWLGV